MCSTQHDLFQCRRSASVVGSMSLSNVLLSAMCCHTSLIQFVWLTKCVETEESGWCLQPVFSLGNGHLGSLVLQLIPSA